MSNDDNAFLDSIIASLDSQGILGLVRDLKEDGNCLYKQRNFEDALEKYGYAGIILAKCEFVDVNDMFECYKLAISILLNSAACFGKKNDFDQVGRICTLVLDFELKNVKAMYRRAMAAVALGKKELAYWELRLATEIDPQNQDVILKLQELEQSTQTDVSKQNSQKGGPVGLRINVPAPKEKSATSPKKVDSVVKKEMQSAFSILQTINGTEKPSARNIKEEKEKEDKIKRVKPKNAKVTKEQFAIEEAKEENVKKVKDVMMMDSEDASNCHISKLANENLAESTYQYRNRRRPDLSLNISRKNYHLLKAGRTITCWNSKLGVWMSIRTLSGSTDSNMKQNDSGDVRLNEAARFDGSQQDTVELQEVQKQDFQSQGDMIAEKAIVNSIEMDVVLDSSSKVPQFDDVVLNGTQGFSMDGVPSGKRLKTTVFVGSQRRSR